MAQSGLGARRDMRGEDPTGSFRVKLFYGMGTIAYGVKDNGFSVLLLLFYNQALGLDVWLAGLAIAIALFFDALIDPVIGYVSDNFRSRWGRRHPFMYAAALPVAISYLLLFNPPNDLDQQRLFLYLLISAILVRSFIAFYEVPSSALVPELTQDYDQRTSYVSFRFFFGWMGGLTMGVAAFGVFLRDGDGTIAGTLLPSNYHYYGVVSSGVMLIAILVSAMGTHRCIPWLKQPIDAGGPLSLRNAFSEYKSALSSRSALTILSAAMVYALFTGINFSLSPYFYTYFWGLSSGQTSVLISGSFIAAGCALLLAPRLSQWFDKRQASIGVTIVMTCTTQIPLLLGLAGYFPAPGSSKLLSLLFISNVFSTTLLIVQGVLFNAMVADVIEENEVRTGRRNEGVFFAAGLFVQKSVTGLGVFASAGLLTLAGFPARANPGTVTADTLVRLGVVYVAALTALGLLSLICVLLFRITREAHLQNLSIIAARQRERLTARNESPDATTLAEARLSSAEPRLQS